MIIGLVLINMKHTILSFLPKKRGFTLIELLVVIGILALLLAITLIAINPAKQFAQANDTKRSSDVNAILNAVDLCGSLITGYLAALPVDPTTGNTAGVTGAPVTVCTSAYNTAYSISKSAANNRVTVTAVSEVSPAVPISVTR